MSTYSVGRSRKHYVYSLLNLDAFALPLISGRAGLTWNIDLFTECKMSALIFSRVDTTTLARLGA